MNTNNDRKHLRLLSIFHYIVGGVIAFFSLIFLGHFFIGISMITSPESFPMEPSGELPPKAFGYLFAALGATTVLLGEALAISAIFSGRFLSRHKKYWLGASHLGMSINTQKAGAIEISTSQTENRGNILSFPACS